MTRTEDVQRYANAIMTMIKEDQDTGQVPRNVCSWDELDESVDTDDYYQQAHLAGAPEGLRAAVGQEVGRRLAQAQGGRWAVTWIHPDGQSHDISRGIGYATQAHAEAVGREYANEHGGTYRVHAG
jgi:hypothetical protein